MQGTEKGGRRQGRQRKRWEDIIREWTGLEFGKTQRAYKDHVTNEEVRAKIQEAIGPHEDLLTIVKRRKLQWYGHVSRSSGLAKTILQGTVKGGRKTRRTKEEVGRQHQGMDRPGVRQVPEGLSLIHI